MTRPKAIKKMETICLTLPSQVIEKVDERSMDLGISKSEFIRHVLFKEWYRRGETPYKTAMSRTCFQSEISTAVCFICSLISKGRLPLAHKRIRLTALSVIVTPIFLSPP